MKKQYVICGGSWLNDQGSARCAFRRGISPAYFDNLLGFRVVKRRAYAAKVICGDSWNGNQRFAHCAYRYEHQPVNFFNDLGFRVIKRKKT